MKVSKNDRSQESSVDSALKQTLQPDSASYSSPFQLTQLLGRKLKKWIKHTCKRDGVRHRQPGASQQGHGGGSSFHVKKLFTDIKIKSKF